jgi:predicted transcriptional regulator
VDTSSASLRLVHTWVNSTWLAPEGGHPVLVQQEAEQDEVALGQWGGPTDLRWDAGGVVRIREFEQDSGAKPLSLSFDARTLQLGPSQSRTYFGNEWVSDAAGVHYSLATVSGWTRSVDWTGGSTTASGDARFFLENVDVTSEGKSWTLPNGHERTSSQLPGLLQATDHYIHGFLDARDVAMTFPEGSVGFCNEATWTVDGHLTAFDASGSVNALGRTIPFHERELTLVGHFVLLDEAPREAAGDAWSAPVPAQAQGNIEALGIDFHQVASQPMSAPVVLGVTAGLGLLALVALGAFLYTRLTDDGVLDTDGRRRIFEAIQANPGIGFGPLVRLVSASPSNTRYHLERLQRHGRIQIVQIGAHFHYVPKPADPHHARKQALVTADEPLRQLLSTLDGQERLATDLVAELRLNAGLSRSGSWKVLNRAEREGLIERRKESGRLFVRRVTS